MSKKDNGWIKLYRSSFDNKLYFSEPFTRWQAWCDLLLLANHKEGFYFVRNIPVKVPRGSTAYSIEELAKRWKWSRGKCERFVQFLESQEVKQIVRQKSRITTLISILNYECYQTDSNTGQTDINKTNGHQTIKQTDTNKNVKKENKVINTDNTIVKDGEKFSKKNRDGSEDYPSWEYRYAARFSERENKVD